MIFFVCWDSCTYLVTRGTFFVCGCINYSLFKLFGHGSPLILVFHGIGLKGSIREM